MSGKLVLMCEKIKCTEFFFLDPNYVLIPFREDSIKLVAISTTKFCLNASKKT